MSEFALQALLVEDEPSLCRLLADVLEGEGFRVKRFQTADDSYRFLTAATDAPALAVFNVTMPGKLTGIELARRALDQWPGLPVVMTSGYANMKSLVPDGAHFLAKPWTLKQFTELVRQIAPIPAIVATDISASSPVALARPTLFSRVKRMLWPRRSAR
ncbi:response regulator [Pseudomonas sp. Marseille-QA0892]